MCHTLKIIFHFILLFISTLAQDGSSPVTPIPPKGLIPVAHCELVNNDGCLIKQLTLNGDQTNFSPIAAEDVVIRQITFQESLIPILDESICKAFPNLVNITMNRAGVQEIQPNAFTSCKEMKNLELDENKVKVLPRETFAENANLESLSVNENQLNQIDKDLFQGAPNLKKLVLRGNMIKTLDPETFQNINKLEVLDLYHNLLENFEAEKILEHTPDLKTVNIRDNYFKCDRLKEILMVLKKKSVSLDKIKWVPTDLTYKPELVEDIECDNVKKDQPTKKPKKDEKKWGDKRSGAMAPIIQFSVIILSAFLTHFI